MTSFSGLRTKAHTHNRTTIKGYSGLRKKKKNIEKKKEDDNHDHGVFRPEK